MNKSSRKERRSAISNTAQQFSDWLNRLCQGELPYTLLWVFATLLLAALIIISLLAQPIADDIWSLAYVPHQSALHYIHDFYLHHNGRFANAIVMVLGIKVFGALVIKIAPILEIVTLAAASIWLVWQLVEDKPHRLERAMVLGGAFTGVYLLVVPSIFDTIVWYTSSTVYMTSIIGIVLTAAVYVYLHRRSVRRWYHYALFGLLVVLNQGFNEPVATITCLVASLLLLQAWVGKSKTISVTATLWTGAIVGFAAIYFSPATHTREEAQHAALHFHSVFIGSLRDFLYTKQMLFSWRVTLVAVLGLAFALAVPALSNQMRKWLAAIGMILCVVPTYLIGILMNYANSAQGGISETRVATLPFAFLVAGLVCLIVALVQSLPRRLRHYLPAALYVAIPISLTVSLLPILNVIRAEILRDSLLRYRDASIQAQVAAYQKTIYVVPAPILLDDSQAVDLSYVEKHQVDWFDVAFIDYYGLRGKTLKVASTPPAGYCLTHSAGTAWWGTYTCQVNATQQVQAAAYTLDVPQH